jgi:CheY-like chemotaxis protein/SOS-response transcriptional repressor LexA
MLTPRQHALLVYIDKQIRETGRQPGIEKMKDAVKARSMSSVYEAIAALEKQGFVARRRGRRRHIEVLRLPDGLLGTPAVSPGDPVTHPFPGSNLIAPAASTPPHGHAAELSPLVPPPEAAEHVATPGPRAAGSPLFRRESPRAAEFAHVRELLDDAVWAKLSIRTQANILGAGSFELDRERVASLIGARLPASDTFPADAPSAPPWPRNSLATADQSFPAEPDLTESAATAGTQRSDILPSLEALQIATAAIRRNYGLTEPTRHPEIVAQAIELSFLLVAYGLVPSQPDTAAIQAGSAAVLAGEVPHRPPTPATPDRSPHIPSPDIHRHVLVVDDVSDVLVSVTAFLVTAGFVVNTAANGDTALRLLAADPRIGVLVTDFAMPGLSGVDLIAQATQLRPQLKALLITGYPGADGLADLPATVQVLAKPFRRAALIERVSVLAAETLPAKSDISTESAHVFN